MKVFIIDMAKCNGCYNCQVACKDEHVGNTWLPYAEEQPDTEHFWLKINETVHGQVPKVKIEYRPLLCQHCDQPACVEAGGNAVYKRDDGLVIIDPVKAVGKKELVTACPYGVIYWNKELQLAQKCTGCAHLVDQGELPHCVDVCATGALRFGEEEEFAAEIAQADVFQPELGLKPRVYYLNQPGLFLGGEVWDPVQNEVVVGAKVTLTTPHGYTKETVSDEFGDFWFRKLKPGKYTVKVEAAGYQVMSKSVELDKSLNIGDFPLQK